MPRSGGTGSCSRSSTTLSSFADRSGASASATVASDRYDGVPVADLARSVGAPALHAYAEAPSTMDLAHGAASMGAAAGTVFVADVQTAGRGRSGRRWLSNAGAGVWATVLERPRDLDALSVLSLRVGVALADALQPLVDTPIALKWPNDLLVRGRKLAGVLAEARWREGTPEWVAIGVGVNREPPPEMQNAAIGLGAGVSRRTILEAIVVAVRTAASCAGVLGQDELARFEARDAVRGRVVVQPVAGRAIGVSARGELLVELASGSVRAVPTATVTYAPLDA